jgi:hypothetical protein
MGVGSVCSMVVMPHLSKRPILLTSKACRIVTSTNSVAKINCGSCLCAFLGGYLAIRASYIKLGFTLVIRICQVSSPLR